MFFAKTTPPCILFFPLNLNHGDPRQPPSKDDGADEVDQWKGAGGQFGLRSDWRLAIQEGGDLRGEACMAEDKREEVREILEKRIATPDRKKASFEKRKQNTHV